MKNQKEYREYIADMFLHSLEEEGLQWKKGWTSLNDAPKSAITGIPYRGVNRFVLTMESLVNGYEDSRWCTFKQIQDKGWRLEKGSKGVQIEYMMPLHPETEKPTTWNVINELKKDNPELQIKAKPQYYYVYNAQNIVGIPPREVKLNNDIKIEEVVPKIAKNMGVEIAHDTDGRAFYRPSEDKVHLPKKEMFHTNYDLYATEMHELSHAAGAEKRLGRDLSGTFGSPSYAYEELVAEMSSCFMSEHFSYELPQEQLDNHKAYVQSWAKAIGDDPTFLTRAIKDADKCATYLEEMGELNIELEKTNALDIKNSLSEQKVNNIIEAMSLRGYVQVDAEDGKISFKTEDNGIGDTAGWVFQYEKWEDVRNSLVEIPLWEPEEITNKIDELIEITTDEKNERNKELEKTQDLQKEGSLTYYTQNISGEGDFSLVQHDSFENALNEYLNAGFTDGKVIGFSVNGEPVQLAEFKAMDGLNHYDKRNPERFSDRLADYQIKGLSDNLEKIKESLNIDNAYHSLNEGYKNIADDAKNAIIAQNSEWGSWGGRIANDSRPQDYVEVDITGIKRLHKLDFNISCVHENEVVDLYGFEVKIEHGNFEEEVKKAFDKANEYFLQQNDCMKEAATKLQTDYDKSFTLYDYTMVESNYDNHIDLLKEKGFEAFPSYDQVENIRNSHREAENKTILNNAARIGISGPDMQLLEDYAKTLDWKQLNEVYQGIQFGLTPEQISIYAKPELDFHNMDLYRYGMAHGLEPEFINPISEQCTDGDKWSEARDQIEKLLETTAPASDMKQIDRAKGDVHIFQDKNTGDNFLGKKLESNGVKRIEKLSDSMPLPEAQKRLKERLQEQKIDAPTQQKTKSIDKGLER